MNESSRHLLANNNGMGLNGREPPKSLLPRLTKAINKATREAMQRANMTAPYFNAIPKGVMQPPPLYPPLPYGLKQSIIEENAPVTAASAAAAAPRSLSPPRMPTYHRPGIPSPGASSAPMPPIPRSAFAGPPPMPGVYPLNMLAEEVYKREAAAREKYGTEAVRTGMAPLPSTADSEPPPIMYEPGKVVPGKRTNMFEGGKRRKSKRKSRKHGKSRKSKH